MLILIGQEESRRREYARKQAQKQAEEYAFAALKAEFGDALDPADRESYILDRGFWRGSEDSPAYWYFNLFPKDIMLGTYSVSFEDADPDEEGENDGDQSV